ncbi:hypothetical protein DXX99_05865 [Ammonifex thiophilus]|uniref:Thioredoxin n=1 Tax=Ammonifex thiophilus TaxID=444093 RepID=A0A3D8P4P7_9THEO|nr:hypothetical protein DXX99_05865 [Ammonifex thiophilus]
MIGSGKSVASFWWVEVMRRWLGRLSLFLGLALVVWGLLRGEFQFLWLKGIRFCLECMGLG